MRMTYLVLAHENLPQLDALIDRLLPAGTPDTVVLHADRRSSIWPALQTRPARDGLRLVTDPVAVRWGHWSQVAAIHRLVAAAVDTGCDYAHLISGADWPIAARETIVTALAAPPRPLCYVEAIAGEQEERMQTFRLDARWLRLDPARQPLAHAGAWELRRLSQWFDRMRPRLGQSRPQPWGPWHKGSTWWSLPADALQEISARLYDLLTSNRLVGTLCADEHVIPTIVARNFSDRLAANRRFIDWSEGESSPRVLRRSDLPALTANDAWFARKFDARIDDFFLTADLAE